MQDQTEERIKQDLLLETQKLEESYGLLARFLIGGDYEITELISNIKEFKDSLSRASAFILALYNLKGQRVNIPWEPLFTSLDYALATGALLQPAKQKASIRTILAMSQAQMEQVMSYFSNLKESLK